MASSSTGPMLVSLFMTPFDVVKVRLQAQDRLLTKRCLHYSSKIFEQLHLQHTSTPLPKPNHRPHEACNCKWYNRPKYLNGTLDAFIKITKVEGLSSLWSGLSPSLMITVPTVVIYLTLNDQLRTVFIQRYANLENSILTPILASGLSGGLARIFTVVSISPLELIRTKMQSEKMAFKDVKKALIFTYKNDGFVGLWKGLVPTLLRDVPFSAVYWMCYEQFKPREFNLKETSQASALAGGMASAVTLPADVIKTRFQLELGENGVKKRTREVVSEILSSQGFRGMFTGLIPRILKVSPGCAITITSYEYCKDLFSK